MRIFRIFVLMEKDYYTQNEIFDLWKPGDEGYCLMYRMDLDGIDAVPEYVMKARVTKVVVDENTLKVEYEADIDLHSYWTQPMIYTMTGAYWFCYHPCLFKEKDDAVSEACSIRDKIVANEKCLLKGMEERLKKKDAESDELRENIRNKRKWINKTESIIYKP